nr:hypothetical protein EFPHDIBJ_EFPHDIBJ_CDS_0005 [Microvirus sp.]
MIARHISNTPSANSYEIIKEKSDFTRAIKRKSKLQTKLLRSGIISQIGNSNKTIFIPRLIEIKEFRQSNHIITSAQIYHLYNVKIHRRKGVAQRIALLNKIINLFKIQFFKLVFIYFY